MIFKFFKNSILLVISLLLSMRSILSLTEMQIKILPKDSETSESRTINSNSFSTRADSNQNYFLIFFDKNAEACDQQAYINIAAEKGSVLRPGDYTDTVGTDSESRVKALLDFYYTEPKGLRFHCVDSLQKGTFTVEEVLYNESFEVQKLKIKFEIFCLKDGVAEKYGAQGSLVYDEADLLERNLNADVDFLGDKLNLKFLSE